MISRSKCMSTDIRKAVTERFHQASKLTRSRKAAEKVYVYVEGETETIAKNLTELQNGDEIDFVCDYYGYDKSFKDAYLLGEKYTVNGAMSDMKISNVSVGEGTVLETYCFTDIYGQKYWTGSLKH